MNSFADGDERMAMLVGAKRFTKTQPRHTAKAGRTLTKKMVEVAMISRTEGRIGSEVRPYDL